MKWGIYQQQSNYYYYYYYYHHFLFIYLFIFGVWKFRFCRVKRIKKRQMREKISKRLLSILRTILQPFGQNIARGNDPASYAGHHWMSYSG